MGGAWSDGRRKACSEAWVEYAGGFYDSLNDRNARLRPPAKHADHSRPMREASRDFEAFREAAKTVRDRLRPCPRMSRMSYRVRVLDDAAMIEDNLPHTLDDTVMLPRRDFLSRSKDDRVELLLHEIVHVYQRKHPIETHRLLTELMGYRVIGTLSAHPDYDRVRRNPDVNDVLYANARGEYALPIVKPDAASLRDTVYVPYDAATHQPIQRTDARYPRDEHPFEHMAYRISDMLVGRRLPTKWRAYL